MSTYGRQSQPRAAEDIAGDMDRYREYMKAGRRNRKAKPAAAYFAPEIHFTVGSSK